MRYYRQEVLTQIESLIPHFIARFSEETSSEMHIQIYLEAGHYAPDGERLEEGWFSANVTVPHEHGYVDEGKIAEAAKALALYLRQNDAKQQLANFDF
ncbi:hypothetical protein [Pseudomonas piscis]|uniref:Uncharacterized protein n=1 Tax=Pseudomonas piscis TaxID=2614538 RepID=A0A7X1PK77_9PSED|nr:hypothetical protein [Pseudomonas piscis]MQA53719.1 hypothetical protein [Pseudomonas piscis]